jgi:hypothetical protein
VNFSLKQDEKSGEITLNMETDEHGSKLQVDVKEGFNKISEVFAELKDAVVKIKGAEIDVKDWTFAVNRSDKEYLVDFKMQMSVKPKKS